MILSGTDDLPNSCPRRQHFSESSRSSHTGQCWLTQPLQFSDSSRSDPAKVFDFWAGASLDLSNSAGSSGSQVRREPPPESVVSPPTDYTAISLILEISSKCNHDVGAMTQTDDTITLSQKTTCVGYCTRTKHCQVRDEAVLPYSRKPQGLGGGRRLCHSDSNAQSLAHSIVVCIYQGTTSFVDQHDGEHLRNSDRWPPW